MFPIRTLKELFGQDIAFSQEMIMAIEKWGAMYRGRAPWVDEQVDSIQVEQGICREFANVCLNEMESSISIEPLDQIYQSAIQDLNENLQSGLALGSFCIKPLGDDKVEYITQERFIPLKFDSRDRLTKVAFIDVKKIADHDYFIRFEIHTWENQMLNIQNLAFRSGDMVSIGKAIPLNAVEEWSHLPENITYANVERPDFGYYRNPIKNTVDSSACGVSIYNSAVNLIKKTDTQFGRLDWEFESGERVVHVDFTALQARPIIGQNGTPQYEMPKLNKRLYRGLNLSGGTAGEELYKEYSPEFRDQSIINGLNAYLRRIEFSVCLSYGDLSDVNDVDKTATEAKIAKKRKYNMVKAIQSNLKDCLEDLVYALAFYNGMTQSGYEFLCTFKDSILVDEEEERQQDRNDVAMGVMRLEEYRAKWYGETLEEATKNLPEPAMTEE